MTTRGDGRHLKLVPDDSPLTAGRLLRILEREGRAAAWQAMAEDEARQADRMAAEERRMRARRRREYLRLAGLAVLPVVAGLVLWRIVGPTAGLVSALAMYQVWVIYMIRSGRAGL